MSSSFTETAMEELVALSRDVGRPERDLVVLAEGNTSADLGDDTFLVKASGMRLAEASDQSFVRLELAPLLAAVSTDAEVDAQDILREAKLVGAGAPSIEAFLHATLIGSGGARWVIHAHPTPLTAILCSPAAEQILLSGPIFPDEAVVCGQNPLFVPYAEPGLELARGVGKALVEHITAYGASPKVVLLANHGLVAIGATSVEADAVTTMAVKAARVRLMALAAGGLNPLDSAGIEALVGRPDEVERRAFLVAAKEGS